MTFVLELDEREINSKLFAVHHPMFYYDCETRLIKQLTTAQEFITITR